ncbi:MAG: orotidine-5'-phosphate decarboxylase [Myxococcota bacterium]
MTTFGERLEERVRARGVGACVGIDPFADRVAGVRPGMSAPEVAAAIRAFGLAVVEAVAPLVPVVKPQVALFERWGAPGVAALTDVVRAARERGLVVIIDGKRGDIGSTAEAYAAAQLDEDGPLGADAATVSPYLGPESLEPYLRRREAGKGMFVLVRTSNPGAAEWQLDTGIAERVAEWIAQTAPERGYGSVGAVVGATLPPAEVARWRAAMPRTWWLVPGFGAQGAGPQEVRPHFDSDGLGALVSSSREVGFPRGGADRDPVAEIGARARAFVEAVRSATR